MVINENDLVIKGTMNLIFISYGDTEMTFEDTRLQDAIDSFLEVVNNNIKEGRQDV